MKRILVILMLFSSFSFIPTSAKADGETKVWDTSTLGKIIKWHKFEYDMFETFMLNEDTLRMVDIEYKAKALDFKVVDSTLFNQLKDLNVSKTFLIIDIADAVLIAKDLLGHSMNIVKLVSEEPYVPECDEMAIEIEYQIANRFSELVKTIIQKSITSNNKNLMNNTTRNDLTKYVLNELKQMRACASTACELIRTTKMAYASRNASKSIYNREIKITINL